MQPSPQPRREVPAPFADRRAGGRALARMLTRYAGRIDTLVLALPRGGVPVGFEVARSLVAPLDVLSVRKLGFPGYPELAMGAVASGGICVVNRELVDACGISEATLAEAVQREGREVARRDVAYRGPAVPVDASGRTVIVVDDGLATGATMRAAVAAVRTKHPASVVVAVPVAAQESRDEMVEIADEVFCVLAPVPFRAVGLWYEDFEQVTDAEVRSLLDTQA